MRGIRGVRPGLAWLLPSLAHALIYDREQQKVHEEQEHAEVCSVFRLADTVWHADLHRRIPFSTLTNPTKNLPAVLTHLDLHRGSPLSNI